MNERLGKEIDAGIRRAKLTNRQLATEAGVSESWVKQVRTGRIDKPEVAKLSRIAQVLPVDLSRLLALSDQLGSNVPDESIPMQGAWAQELLLVAMERQAKATEALVERLDILLFGKVQKYERPEEADAAFAETLRIMHEARAPYGSGPSGLDEGIRRGEEHPDDEDPDTPSPSLEQRPRDGGGVRG